MGLVSEEIQIAGTGSMYPTFPKSENIDDVVAAKEIVAWPKMRRYPGGIPFFGKRLFAYSLKVGDIVEFENAKTEELTEKKYGERTGFVKRIVALPGDTIELRDGFVYVNGKTLDEPFTAKPRSTYGGEFLQSCIKLTIPTGKFFILGDNRKASLDSRFDIGLVDEEDIHYVLPWENQGEYRGNWRNTENDYLLAQTETLDSQEFVRLLNSKRKEKNIPNLAFNPLLSLSAKRRGNIMITTNDYSFEATRSGVKMSQAVKEAGYRNILYAEVFTQGHYDAEELVENFMAFPETKNLLLSKEYQDIGISEVSVGRDACTPQVIVVHLGGYVPPNYSKEQIDSWQSLIDSLNTIIPSLEQVRTAENIDKEKVEKLFQILTKRKNNAEKIVSTMKANQWLSDEEQKMVEEDKSLGQEIEKLYNELTKR